MSYSLRLRWACEARLDWFSELQEPRELFQALDVGGEGSLSVKEAL